jgi:subtilisin family serine protease
MSGTSMATPAVAGAIALFWSAVPSLERNLGKTQEIFEKTAKHQPSTLCNSQHESPNNEYGYGGIDVWKAYEYAKSLGY